MIHCCQQRMGYNTRLLKRAASTISSSSSRKGRSGGMERFWRWWYQGKKNAATTPSLIDYMDTGSAAEILTSPRRGKLDAGQLERLVTHDALAIHIPHFYPRSTALELGQQLAQQARDGQGRNWKINTTTKTDREQHVLMESSDVFTVGAHDPYNVAMSHHTTDEYFANVPLELEQRRIDHHHHALPLWPLDKLRLELDEVWPAGAGLARDKQNPHHVYGGGLPRIMMGPTRWKQGFVHCDELAPLHTSKGLFSANIYLQLPQNAATKGVLEIWPLGIRSMWEWYRVRATRRTRLKTLYERTLCRGLQGFWAILINI